MIPSVTETQLITALGDFITGIVDCEVVRAPANRASIPKGEFIAMTPGRQTQLATNVASYGDTTKSVSRSTMWPVQIDCYGKQAGDRAQAITTLLRDVYGCDWFAATGLGIQPLYATDAQQLPIVSGEAQYVQRWTFEAVLQCNPAVVVPQESATELVIGFDSVDANFKP